MLMTTFDNLRALFIRIEGFPAGFLFASSMVGLFACESFGTHPNPAGELGASQPPTSSG